MVGEGDDDEAEEEEEEDGEVAGGVGATWLFLIDLP